MKKSIGSYFSLEVQKHNNFILYKNSIYLNTGRNAFEYALRVLNVKFIFIPYYSCDAILNPINKLNINYRYYSIDEYQKPIFNFSDLQTSDYFLYINYLGLKNDVLEILSTKIKNLIVDNTQAFFSNPISNLATFYSTRKFFGVPDGALLCNVDRTLVLKRDRSFDRLKHLLLRLENESIVGYEEYKRIEKVLENIPLMVMSKITETLMLSIDFEYHRNVRNVNFSFLNQKLQSLNKYKFSTFDGPLAYPLWIDNGNYIKKKLIDNRIFLPTFWPNVLKTVNKKSIETDMVLNILPIPVDIRYSINQLKKLISIIIQNL